MGGGGGCQDTKLLGFRAMSKSPPCPEYLLEVLSRLPTLTPLRWATGAEQSMYCCIAAGNCADKARRLCASRCQCVAISCWCAARAS